MQYAESLERIPRRLRALRVAEGLTQEALARRMGFAHRQTLASIEAGDRSISAEELVRASEALGVAVEDFTDPFRLVGEGDFSFRAEGVPPEAVDAFQRDAGRWVATYRTLLERAGVPRSHLGRKLELTPRSTFEEAQAAAEEIRREWELGEAPADGLPGAIERELGAQVLFVDAPSGISGAAVHLPGLHTILVNRTEPAGRRNFDLAHELFHLLTWDAMAPERVEPKQAPPRKGNRVERLADNFAGALLMPADTVTRRWNESGNAEVHEWLNVTATSLRVTAVALKWRMVVLGHLTKGEADAIDDRRLAANGGLEEGAPPPTFSREFVTRVYQGIEAGWISLRKASSLLGLATGELHELCRLYGLELSYEL